MGMRASLTRILSAAGLTLRRFWVPLASTVALTTTVIISVSGGRVTNDSMARLAVALVAALLAALCAILLWERGPHRGTRIDSQLAGNLVALPAAGLVVAATYLMLKEFTLVSLSRHAAICLFLLLSFFVIPHF